MRGRRRPPAKYDWRKIAYPDDKRRRQRRPGRFRRYLPNTREVRHALACAVVLVVSWSLWEFAGIGPTLFTNPANWSLWNQRPSASAAPSEALTGRASVIDGDTIDIHGERIRILDIDALETKQPCTAADGTQWRCGQKASLALSDWIGSRTTMCDATTKDGYGRWLARCSVGGMDVAEWLAESGWAVPYRDCKCEVVRGAAARAKVAGTAIWSSDFEMPWVWRKAN
jgi:endonuclease YncB( thermonuclease family)